MSDEKNFTADVEVHLIRAARELLAAAKGVIEGLDAALEVMEERAGTKAQPRPTIEPIPIRRTSET
jgi:hypothetical protein